MDSSRILLRKKRTMEIPTHLAHRRQGSAFPPGWIGCRNAFLRPKNPFQNQTQGDLKEISRNCSFKKENPEYLKSTKMIVDLKISCQDHFITTWNLFSSLKLKTLITTSPRSPRPRRSRRSKSRFWTFRNSRRSRWRPWWIPPFSHGISMGFSPWVSLHGSSWWWSYPPLGRCCCNKALEFTRLQRWRKRPGSAQYEICEDMCEPKVNI